MDALEYGMFFCGSMAGFLAILLPLAKLADWLQKKLDEFNEYNDNDQLNESKQQ